MPVLINSVAEDSPAARAGIKSGDTLVSIGENAINDVLDYRFYMLEPKLDLALLRAGKPYCAMIKKGEYEEPGLEFETYLMDKQHTCKNKCVFCFVDQMPKGMRESLYFKDDDSRMSFLFGNYITLTNLTDGDIERMIKMHISPVNVSVHTTDPELRVNMMKNPHAADSLRYLRELAEAGIKINTQLVLVPGFNDGEALRRTLSDLSALYSGLQSIACVPVGLTRHRDGLPELHIFDKAGASETIKIIHEFAKKMLEAYGERIAYPSDEIFLKAEIEIPNSDYYGEFAQLENGVGLIAMLRDEFLEALSEDVDAIQVCNISIITGTAAAPLIQKLAEAVMHKHHDININVYPVRNCFFGETITVAGLITAGDIIAQVAGKNLGSKVLIPSVMLRHEKDIFLDDMSIEELSDKLGVFVKTVDNDGYELYNAMTGR